MISRCSSCPGHTPKLLMVGDILSQKQEVTNRETILTPKGTKDPSPYLPLGKLKPKEPLYQKKARSLKQNHRKLGQ